jgi:uncharacterized protein involved in exopolysaccharide biosynthesis
MPNLQFEQKQLQLADKHIATATRNIAKLKADLAAARTAGDDTELAQRALAAAENGLSAFLEHRELIVRTIADIEAGRLPST